MISAVDVAGRLHLKRYPRSWRGRCPVCDYNGTFSIRAGRDGRALAYCASCNDRDALQNAISRVMGGSCQAPSRSDTQDEASRRARRQVAALRVWRGSEAAPGTLADRYLIGRGLSGLARSPALRFRGDTPHPEGGNLPAMIALVTDAADLPVAIHRTFLATDGSGKANAEPQKASLGPIWTGAIRLDPVAPEIVIAEGIETAASADRLLNLPAWAAVSAGNLATGLVLPPEVRRLTIAADNDPPTPGGQHPGQDAARSAWFRWRGEGREVRIFVPDRTGSDFNNVLLARLARETAHA